MRRLADRCTFRQPLSREDNMEQWDGEERRVGDGDRRKGPRVPYQEYPKMVDGYIVNGPDDEPEAEAPRRAAPRRAAPRKAGKKK